MKQGKEDFEFVKEVEDDKRNYIFQKNTKTKTGFVFIVAVLIVLILAVIIVPRIMG